MKKGIAIIMVVLLAVAVSACASPSEKLAESIIEGATGQSVNIQGDNMTIQGEEGTSLTISSDGKWPKDKMGDLPEIKGNIISTLESDGGCVISIENVNADDAEAYIKKIKELGYTDVMELTSDDGTIVYSGTKDKAAVMFSYSADGTSIITYGIEQ